MRASQKKEINDGNLKFEPDNESWKPKDHMMMMTMTMIIIMTNGNVDHRDLENHDDDVESNLL